MSLTTTATLIGLGASLFVAWRLGGALGAGASAGFVVGAAVTGWGIVRQRRVIASRPGRALQALVEGFLAKLAVIVLATLALVLVPPLGAALDWRAFLVAFAAAVLIVLLPGTWENAGLFRERRTP